jgi:hypothetical protein
LLQIILFQYQRHYCCYLHYFAAVIYGQVELADLKDYLRDPADFTLAMTLSQAISNTNSTMVAK